MSSEILKKNKNFYLIFYSQCFNIICSGAMKYALALFIWKKTGQATPATFLLFMSSLPGIFLAPIAGTIVDRFNKRYVLIFCEISILCMTFFLFLIDCYGYLSIWSIYFFVSMISAASCFQYPALQTTISEIIPKEELFKANTILQISSSINGLLGSIIGVFLLSLIGIKGVLILNLIAPIVPIVILSMMSFGATLNKNSKITFENVLSDLKFTLNYLKKNLELKRIMTVLILESFFITLCSILIMPVILSCVGSNNYWLTYIEGAFGLGGLTCGLLVIFNIWKGFRNYINAIKFSIFSQGVILILISVIQDLYIWISLMFIVGFIIDISMSSSQSLLQIRIPKEYQGKIFSIKMQLTQLVSMLAILISAPLAETVIEFLLEKTAIKSIFLSPIFKNITQVSYSYRFIFIISGICLIILSILIMRSRILSKLAKHQNSLPINKLSEQNK